MSKFNVGDRVRIVGVTDAYAKYNGQKGTVNRLLDSDIWPIVVITDNSEGVALDESELELVVEESNDATADKLLDEAIARMNEYKAAKAGLEAAKVAVKDATKRWVEAQ